MTDVTETIRGLAAAALDNPAVSLVLADALEEEGESRMAERCRTAGLAEWELRQLADGSAVTPERLRKVWRESGVGLSLAECLPDGWDRERLDACDLVPEAVLSYCHADIPAAVLSRDTRRHFGDDGRQELFLYSDGSVMEFKEAVWGREDPATCHIHYSTFGTELVDRLKASETYSIWDDVDENDEEPDNVPRAYREFLTWVCGDPAEACETVGMIYIMDDATFDVESRMTDEDYILAHQFDDDLGVGDLESELEEDLEEIRGDSQ